MATILHALELPVIEALGWALVHFVWQAALIAGLLVVALIPLRRASARVRYLIECSVLFAMAVCPLATWGWIAATDRAPEAAVVIPIDGTIPAEESTPANAVEFAPMVSVGPDFDAIPDPQQVVTNPEPIELIHEPTAPPAAPISVSWPERFRRGLAPVLPWMVGAWLLGVIVLSLRLAVGWRVVQRLKRMAVTPTDDAWQTRMQKLARRLGVTRTVRLVESTLVEVPTVIGWLRPVILLPLSLLTSLTPQQLDAVLAHELAHIRRHDYLVNLLQTAIETLLFYHPAVWWLSGLIRREREHCCDDLALRMCDSPVTYVTALAKMEEFRTSPRLAVAASGGSLVSRIRRIALGVEHVSRRSVWWSASLIALTAVAALGLTTYLTTHANDDSTNETKRSAATANDAADEKDEASPDESLPDSPPWGTTTNGLRVRVVPVSDSMDETQVDISKSVSSFETLDDVTLAVEIQNASDQPVALRELRYGANYGDSAGKLASDWFGQFLFSIEYFDAEGQRVERPELIPVGNRTEMTVDGALQTTIDPQQSVKMLLRPNRWISALSQQPLIGKQRAIVRYRGVVADKAVEVVAPAVEFSVTKRGYRPSGALPAQLWEDPKDNPELEQDISKQLVWGEPVNGLRAALDVVPESRGKGLSHGTKPKLKLVVQNVSDQPITLASLMWLSELPVKAQDAKGDEVEIRGTWYTGSTIAIRARLKPQQFITFDAGNLGLAVTQERADAFEHVTNRRFVAPSGKYTLQATERFGTSFTLKDGDGNVLVPVDGDFRGNLTTGAATIDISNEIVEGEIVDAVTGKPVEGTTVYFVIVKPKTATSDELPVGNLIWGPKSPSKIYFTIMPEDIAQRPDRDELEIRWGVGNHPDYEDYAPTERIPLKEFFHEGPKTAREVLSQIKLTPKKKVDAKAGTSSLNIKYDMPGAEAETRVHVERIAPRLPSTDWRREEYGNEEYGTVRFSRLKNGQSLTLENLPAGRFQVSRYRLVDMVREGEGKALQHARLDMQIIELTSGETRTVDLSRPAGHSISGSVKFPAEWQVNTLVVHVCNDRVGGSGTLNHPDVRQFDLLNADATGKFKTEPLLPGRYKLVVEGYANHALNVSGIIAPSWERTAEVTISESQEPSPIEVSLHELNRERWLEDQTAAERDSRRAQVIERFQGTWAMDICDSEVAGFGDSQDIVKNWRWAVNGNEIKWTRSNGEIWKLTFTVDPTKSPNEIDLTFLDGPHKGEKCLGMYERRGVGGKLLWFCLTDPGSQAPRPTKVSRSYKEGRTMIGLSLMADAPFEKKAEQADAERSELAVLVESFASARYTWEQHDIVREIIELGDREAISQMEKFLNSENRGTRCNAGLVLARLGDKRGLDCIIQELQDTKARPTTEEVNEGKNNGPNQLTQDRYYAALLLGELADKAAVPALIAATEDETINYRAAISLGEIGDRQAIAALRKMVEAFPKERLWAGYGLAALGESDGFQILTETVSDEAWTLRRHAVEALGKIGDSKAVPILEKALKDQHANVRVSAARALGQIGDPTALPALTEALSDTTATEVNAPTTVNVEAQKAIDAIHAKEKLRENFNPAKVLPDSLNVMSVGFDNEGKLWSLATRNKVTVRSWDVESTEKLSDIELVTDKHANQYLSGELQLSPDRSRVLAISDGKVIVWDSKTGKVLSQLEPPAGQRAHRGLSCSTDLSRVACGLMQAGGFLSPDAEVAVWDVASGQILKTLTHAGSVQIQSTALSSDGHWLATGSQEAGLCIWDMTSGELKHHLPNANTGRKHPDSEVSLEGASQVLAVCFSTDGRQLAMGDLLGVKILELTSGKVLHDLSHPYRFGRSGLVYSSDGDLLARVGTDKTIPLWNARTGKLFAELPSESHRGGFSRDGQWFAAGLTDERNGTRLWKLTRQATGKAPPGAVNSKSSNDSDDATGQQTKRWKFRVLDGDTDQPVSNARLRITAWESDNAPTGVGANGSAVTRDLDDVSGSDDGWLEVDLPEGGRVVFVSRDPRFFHVTQQSEKVGSKHQHLLRCWRGSRFTGRVLQADWTPAANATLNVGARVLHTAWMDRLGIDHKIFMSWDHGQWPNWTTSVTTDDDGRFDVHVPPTTAVSYVRVGSATLSFFAIDDTAVRNSHPVSPLLKHVPFMVELKREAATDGTFDAGTIKLEAGISLTGKVGRADGSPAAGVQVWAEPIVNIRRDAYEFSPHAGRHLLTDEQGGFRFAPLRPGPVKLTVRDRSRDQDGKPTGLSFPTVLLGAEVLLPPGAMQVKKNLTIPQPAWKARRPDSVETPSGEKGETLDDDSVQMSLPGLNWSAPVVTFKFAEAHTLDALLLELLPDTRFDDRRLGRIPGRELKLFEVKPHVVLADGTVQTLDWHQCIYLQNPDDTEVATLIDYATDTGWPVPPLAEEQAAHELVFRLKQPLVLKPGDVLYLEIDSGGSNELDTLARFRVAFPIQSKGGSDNASKPAEN